MTIERAHLERVQGRAHRVFFWLIGVEFALCVLAAIFVTPQTWSGAESSVHPHLFAALGLGGLTLGGAWFAIKSAGNAAWSVDVVAFAGLFVHLTGGRIESHFAYFSLLSLLAMYRSVPAILTATVLIAGDHVIRGFAFPLSLFGMADPGFLRIVEHAVHVVFLDIFLLMGIVHSRKEITERAEQEAYGQSLLADLANEKAQTESKIEQGVAESSQRAQEVSRNASAMAVTIQAVDAAIQRASILSREMTASMGEFEGALRESSDQVQSTAAALRAALAGAGLVQRRGRRPRRPGLRRLDPGAAGR